MNAGKQGTPAILPDPVTTGATAPDPDIWLRRQVELLTLKDSTTNTVLPGFYLEPFPGHTSVYMKFVSNTSAPTTTTYAVGAPNLVVTRTGTFKQALVLVDNTGTIVGFQWETGIPGGKITKSCYTSFKP